MGRAWLVGQAVGKGYLPIAVMHRGGVATGVWVRWAGKRDQEREAAEGEAEEERQKGARGEWKEWVHRLAR